MNYESKLYYHPSKVFWDMGDMNYKETVLITEDAVKIYTYYFPSQNARANIFFLHGNRGNVTAYRSVIRTLVEGGYNVYVVDWRGYGRSEGSPEYKGILVDTYEAFQHFRKQTADQGLKTIVYGMSIGGQLAVKLTKEYQSYVDALVLDGSISSAQNIALDFVPISFVRENILGNPEAFNQDYVAERDIKSIFNIPKLIIHSREDRVVQFYHGELLYANALQPKFFWETDTEHVRTLEVYPKQTMHRIDLLLDYTMPSEKEKVGEEFEYVY